MTTRRTLLTALAILLLAVIGLRLVALDRPAPAPVAFTVEVPDLSPPDDVEPVGHGAVVRREPPAATEVPPTPSQPATGSHAASTTPQTSAPEPVEVVTPAPEAPEVTTEPTCAPGELYDPTIPACVAQQLDDEAIGGARCDDPLLVVVAVLETGELVCGQP